MQSVFDCNRFCLQVLIITSKILLATLASASGSFLPVSISLMQMQWSHYAEQQATSTSTKGLTNIKAAVFAKSSKVLSFSVNHPFT
jgi:hypothetical protein